jgi:hypothetical protein
MPDREKRPTLRPSPKCGAFRTRPRGSALRQAGCWRKEDSLPAFYHKPRGKPGSRSSGACIRASLNISRLPLPFSRQLSSTTSTVVTGSLLSERRLPGAYIDKPLGRSVAQIVANLDGVDLGGRCVLCPEGPAGGDHFDVVSSLRQGADVKNRLRFIEHERLYKEPSLRAQRSNLVPIEIPRREIASSPPAPRNDRAQRTLEIFGGVSLLRRRLRAAGSGRPGRPSL